MKIFDHHNNIYDAVDAVVKDGVAAVSGTKAQATDYCDRIIDCLEPYKNEGVIGVVGYKNVINNAYLYYVYDSNRFQSGSPILERTIDKIDFLNPPF